MKLPIRVMEKTIICEVAMIIKSYVEKRRVTIITTTETVGKREGGVSKLDVVDSSSRPLLSDRNCA